MTATETETSQALPASTGSKVMMYVADTLQSLHVKLGLVNLLCRLLPESGGLIRARLYRMIGLDVGRGSFFLGNLDLRSGMEGFYRKLHIGEGTLVGPNVLINVDAEVHLGKNVSIGPRVIIYTGTHQIGPGSSRRIPEVLARKVTIEDGSWIGLASIILPGVTVGHGSVVAAGAVVMQDVPPNSYVEGNPAQVVRQLPWGDR
jgi:maltose O-acetyltransferase